MRTVHLRETKERERFKVGEILETRGSNELVFANVQELERGQAGDVLIANGRGVSKDVELLRGEEGEA